MLEGKDYLHINPRELAICQQEEIRRSQKSCRNLSSCNKLNNRSAHSQEMHSTSMGLMALLGLAAQVAI